MKRLFGLLIVLVLGTGAAIAAPDAGRNYGWHLLAKYIYVEDADFVKAANKEKPFKFVFRFWDDPKEYATHDVGRHTSMVVEDCDDVEPRKPADLQFHFCFLSSFYSITIPKNLGEGITKWVYWHQRYKLLETGQSVEFNGRKFDDIYILETSVWTNPYRKRSAPASRTFYSKEHGVLGFYYLPHKDKPQSPVFWLDGEKGMGAMMPDKGAVGN